MLVAVASVSASGRLRLPRVAVAYYLAGYLLMTLLSFLVLIVVANHSRGDDIIHFNGLAKRSPFLAFGLLAAMLSLAGVPFTAGFIGKFLVFATAVQAGNFVLLGIGIVTVAAGFYYYLRVVAAMYWHEPGDDTPITIAPLTRFTIGALTLVIFVFGIFPRPILNVLAGGAPIECARCLAKVSSAHPWDVALRYNAEDMVRAFPTDGVRSAQRSIAQLDVPVGEIDEVPPALVKLAVKGDVHEGAPFRPHGLADQTHARLVRQAVALRVLHGMHEQTMFSHVVGRLCRAG